MNLSGLAGGDVGNPPPGDPFALRALASQMGVLAGELQQTGLDLEGIDSVSWQGSAAEAFRAVMREQPSRYAVAGEAYAMAAAVVSSYAGALEDAQGAIVRAGQLSQAGAE